jgi:hypothetical protein
LISPVISNRIYDCPMSAGCGGCGACRSLFFCDDLSQV